MTVSAPHWQKAEEGKDSFTANRFITCGNGDKTYYSAEALHKLIQISQAECRVDIGAAQIDVSLGVGRKKGELGDDRNDKYGAQSINEMELLHDRSRDRRAAGRSMKAMPTGLYGVTFELGSDENGSED